MNIEITESAYTDIETASQFYELQETNLGGYFQNSIFSDIDSLILYAGIHQKQFSKYRLLSHKFPYAIYYDFHDNKIVVIAVLDCRRNPKWIKEKLK
jgi:plasmid stabilization system protein ParE